MEEKLFFGGVKGGKTTKIITLNGKKMRKIPSTIGNLTGLKVLNLQNNLIPSVCSELSTLTQFQYMKLKEFYCEGNPLYLKHPVGAIKKLDVLSLQEITSRFIMNQLIEMNPFLMEAMAWYPQIWQTISKGKLCAICGKSFLAMWIECVEFVPPSKNWRTSRNLKLVPLRTLICSFACFNQRGPNQFGIAHVQNQ
uniref:Leucine rich repeat containing 69 n=1 Tax=Pipistrellus kuhlii TaxID=59472 RepID=A0A7J7VMT4_PIPKU|nr:leucine rich repeat containing 69 [Pipistrellus kuhlii]